MSEQTPTTALFVCIGDRLNADDKRNQYWQAVDPETLNIQVPVHEFCFTSFSLKGAKPGAIYRFTGSGVRSWFTSGKTGPVYVQMLDDGEVVSRLQIEHRATDTQHRVNLANKKDQETFRLLESLEPLRAAYQDASPARRRVLMVLALEYIQTRRR